MLREPQHFSGAEYLAWRLRESFWSKSPAKSPRLKLHPHKVWATFQNSHQQGKAWAGRSRISPTCLSCHVPLALAIFEMVWLLMRSLGSGSCNVPPRQCKSLPWVSPCEHSVVTMGFSVRAFDLVDRPPHQCSVRRRGRPASSQTLFWLRSHSASRASSLQGAPLSGGSVSSLFGGDRN